MSWSWQPDAAPPEPAGMIGFGAVARRLLDALERIAPAQAPSLMAAAAADFLVLTGPAPALPWIDGAQYVAPRAEAAALWLPTVARPTLPLDLLERAVRRRHPQLPVLMLEAPVCLVPLARLLPVESGLLQQIRARWAPR